MDSPEMGIVPSSPSAADAGSECGLENLWRMEASQSWRGLVSNRMDMFCQLVFGWLWLWESLMFRCGGIRSRLLIYREGET